MPLERRLSGRWMQRCTGALLLFAFFGNGGPIVAGESPAPAQRRATFRIPKNGDALRIPVTMDGREYPFVVDTGSVMCVFDESLSPLLGDVFLEMPDKDSSTFTCSVYIAPPMSLGSYAIRRKVGATVMDLSRIREAAGQDIVGILGMTALRGTVLEINYDEGTLSVGDPAPSTAQAGTRMRMFCGRPYIDVTLPGGDSGPFLIDTGSSQSIGVPDEGFDRLVLVGGSEILGHYKSVTLFSEEAVRVGRVPWINVADVEVPHVLVTASSSYKLGLAWLSRFNATFDFPNAKLFLTKSKRFDEPEPFDASGIHLTMKDHRIVIDSVDAESIGAASGVQDGDILMAVDGVNSATLSLFEIRVRLTDRSAKQLVVQREGHEVAIDLRWDLAPEADAAE